jgi:hypothetical protein
MTQVREDLHAVAVHDVVVAENGVEGRVPHRFAKGAEVAARVVRVPATWVDDIPEMQHEVGSIAGNSCPDAADFRSAGEPTPPRRQVHGWIALQPDPPRLLPGIPEEREADDFGVIGGGRAKTAAFR